MALQPDGKILVAGAGVLSFALFWTPTVARFNRDGTVDTDVGAGGLAITSPPYPMGAADAVAVQPDGAILMLVTGSPMTVTRFDPDGSPDTSWGEDGRAYAAAGVSPDEPIYATDLAVQPDGGVVAAGKIMTSGDDRERRIVLARLQPDGSVDPTFGDNGVVQTRELVDVEHVAVQPDGKIVAAGLLSNEPPTIALAGRGMCSGDAGATLGLAVANAETPAENLVVTAGSSDTAALPDSSLRLGGEGAGRSLTVTPPSRASGRSQVTVTVDDGEDTNAVTLEVVVGTQGQDRLLGTGTSDVIVARQGDDALSGDDGRDLLCGGRGDDVLSGGAGDDHIVGERGDDSLTGGDGAGFFNGGQGADVMVDLTSSEGDEVVG